MSNDIAEPLPPSAAAPAAADKGPIREMVIRPRSGWIAIDWRELWEARELLYFLVLRDVKVRYKQTVLGVAWAVLQPFFTMLVFTVIFGRFAKIPSDGLPYAVFVFAGLLPWTFFSNNISQASMSLMNQQSLLTKIYLPRVFVPAASVGSGLIDLLVSVRRVRRAHAVLRCRRGARRARHPASGAPDDGGIPRRRSRPRGADRDLPRLPLRRAVPGAVVDVPESGHLPGQHGAAASGSRCSR